MTASSSSRENPTRPLHAVVVGAGIGGLGAALALSRLGHRVTIVERDDTPMPPDVDSAFEWDRRGAPQVRHTHGFLARLTCILRDRYPDVLQALIAAGVNERSMAKLGRFPGDPEPGDEDLVILTSRRTTYEWVLRRCVLAAPEIDLRVGVGLAGLVATSENPPGSPPRVVGVRLENGEEIGADLVVASTGRRGDVPAWLAGIGVEIPETVEDTGIVYLSRFYRLNDGQRLPVDKVSAGGKAGINYVGGEADNGTYSITMAVPAEDKGLRNHLQNEDRYEKTALLLPELAPLRVPGMGEPITPVHVMGGLINRLRRFTDEEGEPLVLGFHAVGDAHTTTNPLYGRGCSLAMVQAVLLADAIAAHPDDLIARSRAYEAASVTQVEPFYHLSVQTDKVMLARFGLRSKQAGAATAATEGGPAGRSGLPAGIDPGLMRGAARDPVLMRTMARMMNLLITPNEVFSDPEAVARIAELAAKAAAESAAKRAERSAEPRPPRLTREDVLSIAA